MKKFYNLIESETVRNRCEETCYELSTLQCLYLVWNNERISLEKKHALYEKIMQTMPEPEFPEECGEYSETVYELLKEHIKKEKKAEQKFLKAADEPVYQVFYDEKETLKDKVKSHKRYLKDNDNKYEGFEVANSKIKECAWITYDGKIGKLYDTYTSFEYAFNCEELSEYTRLPSPFRYGDIVYYKEFDKKIPCIFISEVEDCCDDANLYCLDKGIITKEQREIKELNILNGEIGAKNNFIKVMSDFLNKKIDVITLLNAYVICFNREQEKELCKYDCMEEDYIKNIINTGEQED